MKAKLAFYKGPGRIGDKLIRLRTWSKYSHVELVIGRESFSSDMWADGARSLYNPRFHPDHWDLVEVEVDEEFACNVFKKHEGKGYDWLGIIFSQLLPLRIDDKNKVFCSELIAAMLGLDYPEDYSPEDLARRFM